MVKANANNGADASSGSSLCRCGSPKHSEWPVCVACGRGDSAPTGGEAKAGPWTGAAVLERLRAVDVEDGTDDESSRIAAAFDYVAGLGEAWHRTRRDGKRHDVGESTFYQSELDAMADALNAAGAPAPKAEAEPGPADAVDPTCACDPIGSMKSHADGKGAYCTTCGLDVEEPEATKVDPYEAHDARMLDEAGALLFPVSADAGAALETNRAYASRTKHATRAAAIEDAERRLRDAEKSAADRRRMVDLSERAAASLRAAMAEHGRAPGARS